MRFTFLGTAAAEGYPSLFCDCANCKEARAQRGRNLRRRSSVLIDGQLLIDLGPDLVASAQIEGVNLSDIRYCLQTHPHSDHLDPENARWRLPDFRSSKLPTLDWYGAANPLRAILDHVAPRHPSRDKGEKEVKLPEAELVLHAITPGEHFDVGPYHVTSVPATHGLPEEAAMLYVIGDDKHTVFYATDTGLLSEDAWKVLRSDGRRFDLVAMDETLGTGPSGKTHLSMDHFLQQLQRLRGENLLVPKARVFAHHFSHQANPAYDKLCEFFAPHGVEVAYDGLTVNL